MPNFGIHKSNFGIHKPNFGIYKPNYGIENPNAQNRVYLRAYQKNTKEKTCFEPP